MSRPVRPPEHYIHGLDGPTVTLSARTCAYLSKYAKLDEFRIENRGKDPEVDAALIAIRTLYLHWLGTATGTKQEPEPEPERTSKWLSVTQVANRLKVTDRMIRKDIAAGKLQATKNQNAWRIHEADYQHYKAARAA